MPPKKILVVEDDADQRLAISIRLKANKYAPIFAGDGVSAIAAAQREHPDLIVLDLGLPGGDGFTVLDRMRTIPRLAGIPIIVLTARDPKTARERTLDLGASGFFEKPVDSAEFLAAIHAALGDGE
ncbi:MAG TPA: response regulator transcription factor [Gemmatimonadales bacterium]|nr:response regulator transcription factor [Gemmatimonadales bacterium]